MDGKIRAAAAAAERKRVSEPSGEARRTRREKPRTKKARDDE
jgi:hypothetical protein